MPLVPVSHYRSWQAAQDHALVVIASQAAPSVQLGRGPNGVTLYTHPDHASEVARSLADYDRLPALKPLPDLPPLPAFRPGLLLVLLWAAVLTAVFAAQQHAATLTPDYANSSIGLFEHGEWWRPFTALFLHADTFHLLSNLASGALFISLASRAFGPPIAWALTLAAASAGNTLTALAHHPTPFTSIGASTAVFAALGILTAAGIGDAARTRGTTAAPWKPVLLPLGGGLALLGWFGAGSSPTTDVLAHLLGFTCGLAIGIPAAFGLRLRA